MLTDSQLTECRNLILHCAPELAASPLYVISQPAELPRPKVCAYVAWRCSNIALKEHLLVAGKWIGPGPVIVLVADDLSTEAAQVVMLHEAAHILPFTETGDPPATAADRAAHVE